MGAARLAQCGLGASQQCRKVLGPCQQLCRCAVQESIFGAQVDGDVSGIGMGPMMYAHLSGESQEKVQCMPLLSIQ